MGELLEAVLDYLCAQRLRVMMMFSLLLLACLFSVLALVYFDSDTAAFAVSVLNLAGIVPLLLGFTAVLYACRGRF